MNITVNKVLIICSMILCFTAISFPAHSKILYNKDIIHLLNGSTVKGNISAITGAIIIINTSEGRQRINRMQVINTKDEVTLRWKSPTNNKMIGNIYYMTPRVLEIETDNGKYTIQKWKVKSIVLGYPLTTTTSDPTTTNDNRNNLLIEKDFNQNSSMSGEEPSLPQEP